MKKILCLLLALMMLAGCATQPIDPTVPTIGATQPTVQVQPTDPTAAPTVPADPTDPTAAPTDPAAPTEPAVQPTEPVTPTEAPTEAPTEPTEPAAPTDPIPTPPAPTEPVPEPTEPTESNIGLIVHYIDVGQADCILLECDGEYMLIDAGNVADSSLVVSYLTALGVEEIDVVVGTHAHEDHMGGLAGVMAVFPVGEVYCPTRTRNIKFFNDFVYYVDQQGLEITIPSPGDTIEFGDTTTTVLGPVASYSDMNDTSIVLMVEYGDTRFLFTGDMGEDAEADMLEYWGEGFDWSADVLKVGHHGSRTSTKYPFLNAVMPEYGVICVGAGNSYGHPTDDTLSRLRDAEVTVMRTDLMGTIIFTSDGKTVTPVNDLPEPPKTETYLDPDGDGYVTVAEAIAICQQVGVTATELEYYVWGTIVSIDSTKYGNMTIQDETGSLYIYGCYSADGATRYDKMTDKPQVGDRVLLKGVLLNYNSKQPEMKSAKLIELVKGDR